LYIAFRNSQQKLDKLSGANKMSALVAHEMSGFDLCLEVWANEADRAATGDSESGF
jgi:hypothetical protein